MCDIQYQVGLIRCTSSLLMLAVSPASSDVHLLHSCWLSPQHHQMYIFSINAGCLPSIIRCTSSLFMLHAGCLPSIIRCTSSLLMLAVSPTSSDVHLFYSCFMLAVSPASSSSSSSLDVHLLYSCWLCDLHQTS